MQVRCIKAFGLCVPGDEVEVPDGAAVDPYHWEVITAGEPPEDPPKDAPPPPAATTLPAVTPFKEGM